MSSNTITAENIQRTIKPADVPPGLPVTLTSGGACGSISSFKLILEVNKFDDPDQILTVRSMMRQFVREMKEHFDL